MKALTYPYRHFLNNQQLPQIFEADDKWNDLRANKIGDEFSVQYILKGGGNEYQRINEIKSTNASFILPLNFPLPMDVEDPDDARFVSLSELKNWEMAPSNPGALEKANINFALTSFGLKETNTFFGNLRKALQLGLSEHKALDALTKTPATLLGVYDQVGSLESGKLANFLIVSGPVFSEQTILYENWIRGNKYALKEEGWKDLRGKYVLTTNNEQYTLIVKGEITRPTAEIIDRDTSKVDLTIKDRLVLMVVKFKKDSLQSERLTGVISDSIWSGTGQDISGYPVIWKAIKTGSDVKTSEDSSGKKKEVACCNCRGHGHLSVQWLWV